MTCYIRECQFPDFKNYIKGQNTAATQQPEFGQAIVKIMNKLWLFVVIVSLFGVVIGQDINGGADPLKGNFVPFSYSNSTIMNIVTFIRFAYNHLYPYLHIISFINFLI